MIDCLYTFSSTNNMREPISLHITMVCAVSPFLKSLQNSISEEISNKLQDSRNTKNHLTAHANS